MTKHLNAIAVWGVKSCGEMTFSKLPCHTELFWLSMAVGNALPRALRKA